jgi:7-cyano-7-deazaguanine synthase
VTHIVVLSGGMDSATVLARVKRDYPNDLVIALGFDYGQRHRREIESARALAHHYAIPYRMVPIGVLHGSALLGSGAVPEGAYDHPSMDATVVSGRNLLFAAIATGLAEKNDTLWFGIHSGDHPVYRDCRPEFWDGLRQIVADAYDIGIATPLIALSKADVVRLGYSLDVPYDLTWSCYVGGATHCGRCGTCVERAEAFSIAGVTDPTVYADPDYWVEAMAR